MKKTFLIFCLALISVNIFSKSEEIEKKIEILKETINSIKKTSTIKQEIEKAEDDKSAKETTKISDFKKHSKIYHFYMEKTDSGQQAIRIKHGHTTVSLTDEDLQDTEIKRLTEKLKTKIKNIKKAQDKTRTDKLEILSRVIGLDFKKLSHKVSPPNYGGKIEVEILENDPIKKITLQQEKNIFKHLLIKYSQKNNKNGAKSSSIMIIPKNLQDEKIKKLSEKLTTKIQKIQEKHINRTNEQLKLLSMVNKLDFDKVKLSKNNNGKIEIKLQNKDTDTIKNIFIEQDKKTQALKNIQIQYSQQTKSKSKKIFSVTIWAYDMENQKIRKVVTEIIEKIKRKETER